MDPLFLSSNIYGIDPDTGKLGGTVQEQFTLAFANMRRLLELGGAKPADVGRVYAYLKDWDHQRYYDESWLAMYPDQTGRPARVQFEDDLLDPVVEGAEMALRFIAVLPDGFETGPARTLDVTGVRHGVPIPMGTMVGNLFFSSAIGGEDPSNNKRPPGTVAQAHNCFNSLRSLLDHAGATTDHVGHMTVFIKFPNDLAIIDREWEAMFPDPEDRPARNVIETTLTTDLMCQLVVVGAV